ncbi:nitroreductase family protein [Acidisoma cellulosilytica]|uniref:Nitroreductase family protein n=1 Tax=Acidisoma cellulosilyticum TaxID=2802395 RepID=A0A963Z257_9PROT|nr:nitroreductase family protein [Acidisoma cellulosilyticum]MCB8880463.1 nitroreductase family protein [Acidisoma cellulosilyticum]
MTKNANFRDADHEIEPIFLERWSPRAFTEEEISEADLFSMFEAARWAPSSYNSQPWVFIYARRSSPNWEKLLGLLNEFNQSWAKRAGAIVIIASHTTMLPPGAEKAIPSHSHSFDAGAAWNALALQGSKLGWHAHAMVGFDIPRAFAELNFPEGVRVEAAVAIGRQGDKSILPEGLAKREAPSPRKPITDFAFEGSFSK